MDPSGTNRNKPNASSSDKPGSSSGGQARQKVKMTKSQQLAAAMKKALDIHLVVNNIVRQLDFVELMECRSVTKSWKKFSSQEMLRRNCCIIKITGNGEQIYELFDTLDDSTDFPCSHFVFQSTDFKKTDAQVLLDRHGDKIKTLVSSLSTASEVVMGKLLTEQARNVETLVLNYYHKISPQLDGTLPNLKYLQWYHCTPDAIMTAAPNLKAAQDTDTFEPELTSFLRTGKLTTLKKLTFNHSIMLPQFIDLVNGGLQLEELEFICYDDEDDDEEEEENYSNSEDDSDDDDQKLKIAKPDRLQRMTTALQKLLLDSKDSLRSLDLRGFCDHLENKIQFPNFNNLKILQVGKLAGSVGECFPSQINLAQHFPHVAALDCTQLSTLKDANLITCFPPAGDAFLGHFLSVQTLRIRGCTEQWMNRLQALCPTFKKLILVGKIGGGGIEVMLCRVFKLWTHLEHLEFEISDESINLNSTLTGMSEETCLQLGSTTVSDDEPVQKDLKQNRSLTDMKGLKRLMIRTGHVRGFSGKVKPPLSRLSGIYAFKLMPDLKVSIEYNQNDKKNSSRMQSIFRSVAPFVNFAHKSKFSPTEAVGGVGSLNEHWLDFI